MAALDLGCLVNGRSRGRACLRPLAYIEGCYIGCPSSWKRGGKGVKCLRYKVKGATWCNLYTIRVRYGQVSSRQRTPPWELVSPCGKGVSFHGIAAVFSYRPTTTHHPIHCGPTARTQISLRWFPERRRPFTPLSQAARSVRTHTRRWRQLRPPSRSVD